MKTVFTKISDALKNKKVQLFIAILFTVATIAAIPIFAWFNHQRQIAELQKVATPDLLYISAACAEDVKFFDMSAINIGKEEYNDPEYQLFPFAVAGEYIPTFTLQFSHTTNNPFTYKIYEGIIMTHIVNGDKEIIKSKSDAITKVASLNAGKTESDPDWIDFDKNVVEYLVKAPWDNIENLDRDNVYDLAAGDTIYIMKGNCIKDGSSSDYLNATVDSDGRIIADNTYHEDTYLQYSNVDKYAEPLYWQKSNIDSVDDVEYPSWDEKPFFKTFILDISWVGKRAEISHKETDIVYISAYVDGL